MKIRTLFTGFLLASIIILGSGIKLRLTQAAFSGSRADIPSPASTQLAAVRDNAWKLLYIDGLQGNKNFGTEPSLAFDLVSDLPYISYYNNETQELVLGRWVGTGGNCAFGAWWCPVVDTVGDVGLGSSLAIHDQVSTLGGKLGISYYDVTNKRLKFAQWACNPGCDWTFFTFPSGTATFDSGRYSSLKYNSLGEPQIAYTYNSTEPGNPWSSLKFCKWVGSGGDTAGDAFSCEYVELLPVLDCCTNPSLGLDPATDIPRIAYYDGQFSNLRLAQRGANGTGNCSDNDWNCSWIDFTGDVGKFPSLDVIRNQDGAMRMGIAYYDASNGKLKYAYPSIDGNCGASSPPYFWQCDTIDSIGTGIPAPPISLILDREANPTIAYQDFGAAHKSLKIARIPGVVGKLNGNCGPVMGILHTYQCDVLDPGGHGGSGASNDGFSPSIARNSAGLIYIAYKEVDNLSGTLKMAYQSFSTFLPTIRK